MDNLIKTTIDKGLEKYSESIFLRVITNLFIPGGPILDIILGTKRSNITQERLMHFFKILQHAINLLQQNTIDYDYINSEEFYDIIIKSVDASIKTRDREKIAFYAKIIKNSIPIQDRYTFYPEDYLSILIELTPREFEVARIIYGKEKEILEEKSQTIIDLEKVSKNCPFIPKEDISFILIRLMRVGLLLPTSGWGGGVQYAITEVFRKIMQYLQIK